MAVLAAKGVSKSFGERVLFADADFEIQSGEKVGLIGANGSGKTTLFKLITGQMSLDSGGFARMKGLRVGYMEQIVSSKSSKTAMESALEVFADLIKAEAELEALTERLADGDEETITRQHRLRERFEAEGGLTYRARTRSALLGLGLNEEQLGLPLSALSGGQLSKISLARLLLSGAELLLLDEPTNHLDIPSVEWLEGYLKGSQSAAVIISHDRYFLDAVTTRTLEIENGRLTDYKGSYSRYLELKKERREIERRHYDNTMQEIERLEAVIKQQHQWNKEKNIRTADSKQKVVDKLREGLIKPEVETEGIRFSFSPKLTGANEVVVAEKVSFSYGDEPLYRDVSFTVRRGERVFLLGANGCGKTTLLKQMLNEGNGVRFGAAVCTGYFDQTQSTLSPEKTALSEVWDDFPDKTQSEIRGALAAFLFKNDDVFKTVGELSGGERARLMILKMMLEGNNLLLLDEPTNHLDVYSRQALEQALADYNGTMLIVSHDRRFIDRLADRIFVMENGGVTVYDGNYTYYTEKRQPTAEAVAVKRKMGAGGESYKAKKELQSQLRRIKGQIASIERELEGIDGALEEKNAALCDPSIAADYLQAGTLTEEIALMTERQESLLEEWARLSEELEAMEVGQ